ncbi:MAG: hypothetical protein ACI9J2_001092 [Saprospiraceae bacterium]|jgi:hypothetical protein
MLPVIAMEVMGMMKKKGGAALSGGSSSSVGLLRGWLDTDNDGSIMDDILSLAVRFF